MVELRDYLGDENSVISIVRFFFFSFLLKKNFFFNTLISVPHQGVGRLR